MTALRVADLPPEVLKKEISLQSDYSSIFTADHYEIKQPFFQILEEGYEIASADGKEHFQAVRPRHVFRNTVAGVLGVLSLVGVCGGCMVGGTFIATSIFSAEEKDAIGFTVAGCTMVGLVLGIFAFYLVQKLTGVRRHLTLYPQGDKTKTLMKISPASKFFIFNHEYHIFDMHGTKLASFKKNVFESAFRRKWHCYSAQGTYMYSAIEDSLFKALLRRMLGVGKYIPMHFSFQKNGGKSFGEFRRKYSIKDKYRLTHNPKAVESWLVLATALLLDTGEER